MAPFYGFSNFMLESLFSQVMVSNCEENIEQSIKVLECLKWLTASICQEDNSCEMRNLCYVWRNEFRFCR